MCVLGLLWGAAQRSTVALRAEAADERRGDGASSPRGDEALQASLRGWGPDSLTEDL